MNVVALLPCFPHLVADEGRETSPQDGGYNCIAWAAGDTRVGWWPVGGYWPASAPPLETLPAFIEAYRTLGYDLAPDGALTCDFEKIVIYCNKGVPTHAARQLHNGAWTSKLGDEWDIEHATPRGVEGPIYGIAVQFMQRPLDGAERAARFRGLCSAWFRR